MISKKNQGALQRLFNENQALVGVGNASHKFRIDAFQQFNQLDFPHKGMHAWKKTNIDSLNWEKFSFNNCGINTKDQQFPRSEESEYSAVIKIHGNEISIQYDHHFAQKEVQLNGWASELQKPSEEIINHLGKLIPAGQNKISALTHAFSNIGFIILIPANVSIEKPILVDNYLTEKEYIYPYYSLLVLGEGSTVNIIHQYSSNTEENIFSGLFEICIKDHASLNYIEIQKFAKKVWNLNNKKASLGDYSKLNWFQIDKGSRMVKNNIAVDLAGKNSDAIITGVYEPVKNQKYVFETCQSHSSPQTRSNVLYHGVNYENSFSKWQGMIHVDIGAINTDAYQASHNLIMSPLAEASAVPGLEILTDDVRCSHGVTISQIDQNQLFYLNSRGIEDLSAKQLIKNGFIETAIARLDNPFFQKIVKNEMKI